jgi:hypothetical protein
MPGYARNEAGQRPAGHKAQPGTPNGPRQTRQSSRNFPARAMARQGAPFRVPARPGPSRLEDGRGQTRPWPGPAQGSPA